MLTITVESAQKAVRQVLQMFGEDYTFADEPVECQYAFAEGRPGCLVGWIIWLHDEPTLERIRTGRVNAGRTSANYASVSTLVAEGYIAFETPELQEAFVWAQADQDSCHTWGESAQPILVLN